MANGDTTTQSRPTDAIHASARRQFCHRLLTLSPERSRMLTSAVAWEIDIPGANVSKMPFQEDVRGSCITIRTFDFGDSPVG